MTFIKNFKGNAKIISMLRRLNLKEFISTYSSLATLLAQRRRSAGTNQVVFETPPGQTTFPEDPNRSGGSSSSTESKPELYAQNVAIDFLKTTHSTVAEWMEDIGWVNSEAEIHLSPQSVSVLSF
jgi:hypothetical protein